MTTRSFYVVGSFHVPSRNLFVLVGDVAGGGEVEPGTTFAVRLNPGLQVTGRVADVELIELAYMGKTYRGLVVHYDDPDELGFWQALNISDEPIELCLSSDDPQGAA